MKKIILHKKTIFSIFAIGAIFLFALCAMTYYNANKIDDTEIPLYYSRGSYVFDVYNSEERAGHADYIFIGKIDKVIETEYKYPIMIETEERGKIVGKEVKEPFTNYSITVLENMKGNLIQYQSIPILKEGGISQNKRYYSVLEDDFLPEVGKVYIFYAYAQPDGSLLVTGPGSNIEIKSTMNTDLDSIQNTTEYQDTLNAYKNQKISTRERFVSDYDSNNEL
ncbi:hypothetical protein [Methanolapillus ohkumae]|uniref:Uncharacterized protein n=1 Tax=Methanolapillus ohkumae TaxID=3028298 RepID=A0AA96VJP1_9EURY|nr:hypothetical protein MsAm2_14500 [Methanosarcinaceae archaeon Am2]